MDIPGLRLRSVVTGPTGRTLDHHGDYRVDDRTPFEERWGGWYVTGTIKSAAHLGNAIFVDGTKPEELIKPENLSVASLTNRFATEAYPLLTSDIAALMIYEHQAQMTNLLIRAAWDARVVNHPNQHASRELTDKLLANNALEVVDYMLFADEVPLPGQVESNSSFAETFSAQGPRDKQGRTLRQLDLQKRLMRYPCSYMIYSNAFDALPAEAKSAIYKRMWHILNGSDNSPKYSRLSRIDRQNLIEILRDTKTDLPAYFK